MNPETDLVDLVEQSKLNRYKDDFGFSDAYGVTEEEFNEEWN